MIIIIVIKSKLLLCYKLSPPDINTVWGFLMMVRSLAGGYNRNGQIDIPDTGEYHFVQIAARNQSSLGLLEDGSVLYWGVPGGLGESIKSAGKLQNLEYLCQM